MSADPGVVEICSKNSQRLQSTGPRRSSWGKTSRAPAPRRGGGVAFGVLAKNERLVATELVVGHSTRVVTHHGSC